MRPLFLASCSPRGPVPRVHILRASSELKTWMAGTSPAMTVIVAGRRENCFGAGRNVSRWQLGGLRRIVEEPLAPNLVAAPFLQRDFVEPAGLAGMIGKLEYPVNRDMVALDDRGHAGRGHAFDPLQHRALMRYQHVAADPWQGGVLLHAGVLGVEALDRAGMIAGDDGGDEFIETGARWHGTSGNQMLGPGISSTACSFARRLANDANDSTARPSSTGGNTTMFTIDQP